MPGEFVRVTAEIAGVRDLERAAVRMEGASRSAARAAGEVAKTQSGGIFAGRWAGAENVGRMLRGIPMLAMGLNSVSELVGDVAGGGAIKMIAGAVGTATQGLMMGSVFGPLGAAIGGVTGGLIGLVDALGSAERAERERADEERKRRDAERAMRDREERERKERIAGIASTYSMPKQLVERIANAKLPGGVTAEALTAALSERAPTRPESEALARQGAGITGAALRLGPYATAQGLADIAMASVRTGLGMTALATVARTTAEREVRAGRASSVSAALATILEDVGAAGNAAQAVLAAHGADITAARAAARAGEISIADKHGRQRSVALRGETESERMAEALSLMQTQPGATQLPSTEQVESSLVEMRKQASREAINTVNATMDRLEERLLQVAERMSERVAERMAAAARQAAEAEAINRAWAMMGDLT